MPRLHRLPERALTDREISKILGGAVGGLWKAGVHPDQAKRVMEVFSGFLRTGVEPLTDDCPDGGWVAVLGGVIGGLCGFCRKADILNAVDWIIEHWADMVALMDQATRPTAKA